jgi:hypothetical protein
MVDWSRVYDALVVMDEVASDPGAPAGLRVAAQVFLMNMALVEMPSPGEVKRRAGRCACSRKWSSFS